MEKSPGLLPQVALVAAVLGVGIWLVSSSEPEDVVAPRTPVADAGIRPAVDAGAVAAPKPVVPPQGLDVRRIESSAQFDAIAFSGARGVVLGNSVKFLVDKRDPANLRMHFMNAKYSGPTKEPEAAELHYAFAVEVLGITETAEEFNDLVYVVPEKKFVAGTVQQYHLLGEDRPTYAIQFYPQDTISERQLLISVGAVVAGFDVPDARLVFVPTGQQQTTKTVAAEIAALGIEVLALNEVLGAVDFMPMQVGEAWGFLRVFPGDPDTLSATDIPVFDELPLDLTVVAGCITRAVQDNSSHINLKSKERGTPNMMLRSAALDHPLLAKFADKPVHLVVEPNGFTISPATEEMVKEKLAARLNRPWRVLEVVPSAKLTGFDAMCRYDPSACVGGASRWGGKAANLGFLRHRKTFAELRMRYDVAPPGVAVPVQTYFDFVAANPILAEALSKFITAEKAGTMSVKQRTVALRIIQERFMRAKFAPGVVEAIRAAAVAALPVGTQNLKVRSSANAEDISGFDGAGLYDSFRVRLSDEPAPCVRTVDPQTHKVRVRPRTTECVIKAVYASLWNKRAVEERSYARVDHATAGMGLAIVQRYSERGMVVANSVVVTRVMNSDGVYGYSLSSQRGNNVVTNPEPGTHSESVTAGLMPMEETTFTVSRYAKPDAGTKELTETVLTRKQMKELLDIAQEVERSYCLAKKEYYTDPAGCDYVVYDSDKPVALDLEFKLFANGEFLCKQVREFSGR